MKIETSAPPKKQANYYQNKLMFEHSLIGAITFFTQTKGEQRLKITAL